MLEAAYGYALANRAMFAEALSTHIPLSMLALAVAAVLCTPPAWAQAGEFGVNVYGLSYHLDRARAHELRVDNELNIGLGVRYRMPRSERFDWIFDAGAYRDSGRKTALVAGAGALWKPTERLRLGAALALFDSDTYNRGRTFIAPLPVAAYELGPLTLNFVYLPKFRDVNPVSTLGFWATIWLRGS